MINHVKLNVKLDGVRTYPYLLKSYPVARIEYNTLLNTKESHLHDYFYFISTKKRIGTHIHQKNSEVK